MTEEVLTPSQIVEIVIFYCSPTDSNTFIRRWERTPLWRGGGGYFLWIINGTLFLIFLNNLNTFLRKINWGSYEKIIRFYFLYEILKESIFFKKIWVKLYLTTNPK